jgi:hypothetical protein
MLRLFCGQYRTGHIGSDMIAIREKGEILSGLLILQKSEIEIIPRLSQNTWLMWLLPLDWKFNELRQMAFTSSGN